VFRAEPVFAETIDYFAPGFEGGISNENEYMELLIITGEPIILKGSCTISPGRLKNNVLTTNYTYKLKNAERDAELDRRITIETVFKSEKGKGQIIATSKITGARENIRVGGYRYKLEDYQFSQSTIADNNPAISYYAGSWDARKTYSINRDRGTVIIHIIGELIGHSNTWGGAETQTIKYFTEFNGQIEVASRQWEEAEWTASSEVNISVNRTRNLAYVPNEPAWISFRGGYIQTNQTESILQYEYNTPKFSSNGLPLTGRKTGWGTEKLLTVPVNERLPIPVIKDIEGHWAQNDIERLASLEVLAPEGSFFGPRLNMTRGEFARAIAVTTAMTEDEETEEVPPMLPWIRNQEQTQKEQPLFKDVPPEHRDFKYIQLVGKKGVMAGVEPARFGPDGNLTRAQALTIIIRALGLEGLAPNPPFSTHFTDDADIPGWAKPSVYVAYEIGLVNGDSLGRVLPNQVMTRAEAAAFLNRFITFLQYDIKREYIDRILNY
jgi:hypothetical protein